MIPVLKGKWKYLAVGLRRNKKHMRMCNRVVAGLRGLKKYNHIQRLKNKGYIRRISNWQTLKNQR